jgi:hypothetical protein
LVCVFYIAVVTLCWEIHSTTKGLLSLRKRGMHIICADYYLLLSARSNFRFVSLHFIYKSNQYMKMLFSFLWFSIILFISCRRRNLCITSANTRFLCKSTRPWWTFRYACMITCATDIKWWYEHWKVTQQHVNRRGMKGCFTNFLLTMLRNCSQLYILQLSVRLARNMVAYSSVLRVYTLVWKRSMSFFFLH